MRFTLACPAALGLLLVVLGLGLPSSAQAHDYWLKLDSTSRLAPGAEAPIRMWVGDSIKKGEEDTYSARKARSFVHLSGVGTTDLKPVAVDGAAPVVTLRGLGAGGHLVGMERSNSHITLPGWKFTSYLKTEKLEEVMAARKASGATWSEGRERYSRYLKTLIQVGSTSDEVYGAVLGQRYELVFLNDPTEVQPGEALVVRLLFDGVPKEGARVVGFSPEHSKVEARTDANGVVRLILSGRGEWLIRSVHMQPCSSCKKVDWESFWASYHFNQYD